jgi:hypothetical protein
MAKLILKVGVFDGEAYIEDGAVVVDQEKSMILDSGHEGDIDLPRDAKVLGASSQTVIPD